VRILEALRVLFGALSWAEEKEEMLMEAGGLLQALLDALRDGKVSDAEMRDLRARGYRLLLEMGLDKEEPPV
jgi:hypothetical protein